jgi:hypothetical protein
MLILYRFRFSCTVHEDDVGMGVFVMFLATLGMLFAMIIYISCSYDRDSSTKYASEYRAQARGAGINTYNRRHNN